MSFKCPVCDQEFKSQFALDFHHMDHKDVESIVRTKYVDGKDDKVEVNDKE